jgi:hypothetical protein
MTKRFCLIKHRCIRRWFPILLRWADYESMS